MAVQAREYYRFDEFELDLSKRRLSRAGKPIPLKPKAFDLLLVLVENSGQLLSKDELFRLVWGDRVVEESNLSVYMTQIRKALGETAKEPRYITTVSGEGYRFIGEANPHAIENEEIIEQHSFARIVVESENDHAKTAPRTKARTGGSKFRVAIALGILVIAALAFSGYLLRDRLAPRTANAFEHYEIKRLTTNGRVTYATLSPDGNLFAYSMQEKDGRASLWLGHVNGSREMLLREPSDATYSFVKFAPDGNMLFFVVTDDDNDSNLFRMPVFGGKAEKVKDKISFLSFAPNGREYAFVRTDETKSALNIADLEGNERELVSRPPGMAFNIRSLTWSPDAKLIAAAAVAKENLESQEVFVVTVDDGSVTQLTNLDWQLYRSLVWQNDSSGLVAVASEKSLSSGAKLWHIAYPAGDSRPIINDLNAYGQLLDLSADNRELLALQFQHQSNVWIASTGDLSGAKQITFDSLGKTNGWYGVDWMSPDKMVYTAVADGNTSLWYMNADGTGQNQLTSGANDFHVSASEACGCVVFESDRNAGKEIWRTSFDGRDLRQLTHGGKNVQPHISPDGEWIAFASTGSSRSGLWIIPSAGGEEKQIWNGSASFPRWSPDGKFVAFHYGVARDVKVAILSIDKGTVVQEFSTPRNANLNLGVRWSPDGNALTYRDWANGLWRQEINGGEPQRVAGLPEEKIFAFAWSPSGSEFAFTRGQEIRDVVLISVPR